MGARPPRSNQMSSRWRPPDLYITIVSIYLLALIAIESSIVGYFYLNSETIAVAGLESLDSILIQGLVLIIPSAIGAILLLLKKKPGRVFALAALIIILTNSPVIFGWFVQTGMLMSKDISYVIFFLTLISASAMFVPLILGWKRVQWL